MNRWFDAQTLQERLHRLRSASERSWPFDREIALRRLGQWKSAVGEPSHFARLLAIYGCTESELELLLGIPASALFPPGWTPDWLREILDSETVASPDGILTPCSGLLKIYGERLTAILAETGLGVNLYPSLFSSLRERLAFLSQRAMVLEVNVQSALGRLGGDSPEARFHDFITKMTEHRGQHVFLEKYPVLARSLQHACVLWLSGAEEFCRRLASDWSELRSRFAIRGELEGLSSRGDFHSGGRSVAVVNFRDGKVVYKPRPLNLDRHFQELLTWLNEKGLEPSFRRLEILDRDNYGWIEHIAHVPGKDEKDVDDFYYKLGALLAVSHALAATDMHFENLVAHAADPVLVDLETLFHAEIQMTGTSSALTAGIERIRRSVMAVGLLPTPVSSAGDGVFDGSGIGGVSGQATPYKVLALKNLGKDDVHIAHVPGRFSSTHNRPGEHAAIPSGRLMQGFTSAYSWLENNRDALRDGPLRIFAKDQTRLVVRPTRVYGTLALDATHPDLLRDGMDRARHWSQLFRSIKTQPDLEKFISSEIAQLDRGDVPSFSLSAGTRDARGADGTDVPNAVIESGLDRVSDRLAKFSDKDLREQEWFIRASMGYTDGYIFRTEPDLLAAAVAVGNEIVSRLHHYGDEAGCLTAVSISGEHQTENLGSAIHPTGTGLYDGVDGIALFLAYLSHSSGHELFRTAAESLLKTSQRMDERRSGSRSATAFSEKGALIYLLSHLGSLWNRDDLLDSAERLLLGLEEVIASDEKFDIVGGISGLLLALLSLAKSRPQSCALKLAKLCGVRLQAGAWERTPYQRGFSHGAAGVSFALSRLFSETGEKTALEAAVVAAEYEHGLLRKGQWTDRHFNGDRHQCSWCHGAVGIALARQELMRHHGGPRIAKDLQRAVQEVRDNYWMSSQCLCHGVLGNLEALEGEALSAGTKRILDEISTTGWRSALPNQTLSLGLFTGLAGLGYGLLRLHDRDGIPSVLTLSPPSTTG